MKVSKLLIAATVTALIPLSGAFAQTKPSARSDQPAQEQQQGTTFEALDANGDGKISKVEAAVNANVSQQFTKYDKNGDGFIEKEEVVASNTSPTAEPTPQP